MGGSIEPRRWALLTLISICPLLPPRTHKGRSLHEDTPPMAHSKNTRLQRLEKDGGWGLHPAATEMDSSSTLCPEFLNGPLGGPVPEALPSPKRVSGTLDGGGWTRHIGPPNYFLLTRVVRYQVPFLLRSSKAGGGGDSQF